MKTKTLNHEWTGLGPQIVVVALSDGSKVYNVTILEETIFCVDEKHALQFISDLNEAAAKAT